VTPPPDRCRRGRADLLVAATVACLVAGLALLQLFLGPDLGLADNGDGRRVLCGADLQPPPLETAFTDVVFEIGPLTDPAAGNCGNPVLRYSTSQIVLVDAVRFVDGLVSGPGLDLRAVGATVAVLLGLGVGALYLALGGRRPARLVTVAAATAMLLDVSYLHYASSPFSESIGFLGLVWTAAALAWLARRPLGAASLVTLLLVAAVLVTAKSQLTALAVLVLGAVVLRVWQHLRSGERRRWPAVALAGLVVVGLTGLCGLQLAYQGPEFTRANTHNLTLFTVAPLADDPAAALTEMGLDPGLAEYAGTNAFSPDMAGDPDYAARLAEAGRADVARYLLHHPDIAWAMLRTGVEQSALPRTPYLPEVAVADRDASGTTEADRWAPGTTALERAAPVAWPLLPIGWVVLTGWGLLLALRRSVRGHDMRSWGYALTFTAAAAAAQVVVALIGDGFYELAKHEVFVSHLTWIALALGLGSLVQVARRPADDSTADGAPTADEPRSSEGPGSTDAPRTTDTDEIAVPEYPAPPGDGADHDQDGGSRTSAPAVPVPHSRRESRT